MSSSSARVVMCWRMSAQVRVWSSLVAVTVRLARPSRTRRRLRVRPSVFVLEEGVEFVLHVGVALGVQGADDGVGADDLVLLVAGVELPPGDQSALDGQGAQVAFELGLEPGGVVDEVASAVGDAALDSVDADDPVGHHDVAVQVRVQGP